MEKNERKESRKDLTITIGLLLIMVIMFAITGCMANIEEVIKLNKADYDALIKRKLSLEGEIKEERDKQRECLSKVEESKKQNEEKK